MKKPLLTIVIANYNYGRFLSNAIESVLNQHCDDVELIVVDGGSTDSSVEIIKRYEDRLAWWVSEPDRGQSDAFNKGFARAAGKYLTWLNADDLMVQGSLQKIISALKQNPNCEWFTGNFYRFEDVGNRVSEIGWGPRIYPKFLQFRCSPVVVFGPTSFFSKKIYEEYGRIDERFHLMMDTDLWVRFIVGGIRQKRIPTFCWAFRMHEESKTAEFGGHRLDDKSKRQFRYEMDLMYDKTGYKPSRLLYYLLLIWRILDFSLIERFLYGVGIMRIK